MNRSATAVASGGWSSLIHHSSVPGLCECARSCVRVFVVWICSHSHGWNNTKARLHTANALEDFYLPSVKGKVSVLATRNINILIMICYASKR